MAFTSTFCPLIAMGVVSLMASKGERNKYCDISSGLCKTSCVSIIYISIHLTSFHYEVPDIVPLQITWGKLEGFI